MLNKWKCILSNWINCYFNDTKTEECITINTLLTIISHLHKNLNLDDSKSSILEAQNIEEFILEKYPQFKFGNGAVEPTNEEELYVVASLLLFFVCVISKNMDVKQIMCSRLSPEDQETIMKFSKCLMECSPITYSDVQAAIVEACGQEATVNERGGARAVAETPPALRSLHGEVRRLQASLDAERFDRNYLQEELSRNNLRMEKLLKDKEQLKLEIVDLKAKISMHGLEEGDTGSSVEPSEGATRLARQLQELEERLVDTQGKLDDAQYERDAYRAKVSELKLERDKWLSVSQDESSRASQLAEELDAERRRVGSLQELVAELRQHHQNNRLDASQLECDDPDASIHSLHNASVCSEACANVIEVQLGEEKVKVDTLKQQLEALQGKMAELTQRAESDKLALENIITEKDEDISSLKHRIDEEVQGKTILTAHFNDEISKLSNEINELEQKLKENSINSRTTIQLKMQEIQTIQEEKISLLQTLSDETTKLENIIKDLKNENDTEKNLKVQMREDYENRLMKLNEKVLNRNNELVELQNKVFEKGEMLEMLNADLKKEKVLNHELSNKHNDELSRLNEEMQILENKLQKKTEDAAMLQNRLLQNGSVFDELNKEIDDLKAVNENLLHNYKCLEQTKESLYGEIQQRDQDLEGIRKEIENITNIFSEEKDKFMINLEERSATINALHVRLQDEIKYKIGLENELQNLHQAKMLLNEEVIKLNNELSGLKADLVEKDRMIYALELYLKEERHNTLTLNNNNEKMRDELVRITQELSTKSITFEEKESQGKNIFEQELRIKDDALECCNNKLLSVIKENEQLQLLLKSLTDEKEVINKDLIDRCRELEKLQEDYDKLCNTSEQNMKVIEELGNKIASETEKYCQLKIDFDTQTSNLVAKLNNTEKTVKKIISKSKLMEEDRDLQIQSLQNEVQRLNETIANNSNVLETAFKEKEGLINKLDEETSFKNNIEKEYQTKCAILDDLSSQFNNEIALKTTEINSLRNELEILLKKLDDQSEELKIMELKNIQDNEASRKILQQKENEIEQLKNRLDDLRELNDKFEKELQKEIANKTQAVEVLQRENEQLLYTIEEDNSNHEVITKEKDAMIEGLEEHIKILTMSLESLRKDYEDSMFTWESMKIELQDKVESKDNDIIQLKDQFEKVKHSLEHVMLTSEEVQKEIKQKTDVIKDKNILEADLRHQIEEHVTQISQQERKVIDLQNSYRNLEIKLENKNSENSLLAQEKSELHKQNSGLLEDLYQEQSVSKKLLTESKIIANENSLLSEQLAEEKSGRDTAEKEINALREEKTIMQHQLSDKEAIAASLVEEKNRLILKNNALSQHLQALEEDREQILADKRAAEKNLSEREVIIEKISEEHSNLSQQLEIIELVKQACSSEKRVMEQQLLEKEFTVTALLEENKKLQMILQELESSKSAELEDEKIKSNVLLVEKESLAKHLEREEQLKRRLLLEKQAMEQEQKERDATLTVLTNKKEEHIIIINSLSEQIEVLEKEKKSLLTEKELAIQELVVEKQSLEYKLKQETIEKKLTCDDKEALAQQLETVIPEKEQILLEKQALEEQLKEETTANTKLIEVKEYLIKQIELLEKEKMDILSEKDIFTQNLQKEMGQVVQKLNKEQGEKQSLQQQLTEEIRSKNKLLEVNEYLSGQLTEQKSANDALEKEKETLQDGLNAAQKELIEEIEHMKKLIEVKNQEISNLNEEIEHKVHEIFEVNKHLNKEKTILARLEDENHYLKGESIELNAIKDILLHDKEFLSSEKEQLMLSLTEEKASRDELESEKNAVSVTLKKLNEKYALEIKDKQDHITAMYTELKQVKTELEKHEDLNVNIETVINSGLDKLLQNIDKEKDNEKVLQNLVIDQNQMVELSDKCKLLINIADTLFTELALRQNLANALKNESTAVNNLKDIIKEKEGQVLELHNEVNNLQRTLQDSRNELTKQTEIYNTTLDNKVKDIQKIQLENKSLNNELNDVKVQLDVKVHSLKEKLIDNENLTDKLKKTYECQIDNLNVMVNKLTNYLKEKSCELDILKKEKEKLQQVIVEKHTEIQSLSEEVKSQKASKEKLMTDFESERQVITNMVTITESVLEDQKVEFNKLKDDYEKTLESYQNEKKIFEQMLDTAQKKAEQLVQEKQCAFDAVFNELTDLRKENENAVKKFESNIESLNKEITALNDELMTEKSATELLQTHYNNMSKEKESLEKELKTEKENLQKKSEELEVKIKENVSLVETVNKLKHDLLCLQTKDTKLKIKNESYESELLQRIENLTKALVDDTSKNDKVKFNLQEKLLSKTTIQEKINVLTEEVLDLIKEKNKYISKLDEIKAEAEANDIKAKEEIKSLTDENNRLASIVEKDNFVMSNLEQKMNREAKQMADAAHDRLTLENRCSLLLEYQTKAEKHIQEREKEIAFLKTSIKTEGNLETVIENLKEEIAKKDAMIADIARVKGDVIDTLNKELLNEKTVREKYQAELEWKVAVVQQLTKKLEDAKKEAEEIKAGAQRDTCEAVLNEERTSLNRFMEIRDRHQVSTPTSDLTQSSMDSFKTITDLEKIIHDKNRTITTLQSDITYLKSLIADSENKILDTTKELEISKENCEQLSIQLKKLVQQKNEEIADLKKQVSKMSVTENRATQIIKVSAKYQAIILKRIAEIKSNTILKELTNFGNTANCDSELKRNLNSGAITMEDLENFLETTDKHLKRCSDKQVTLQKERDRLSEVNKINESEIINMKKFLTELSVGFKTFNSIKDLYTQKMSRVVSMQRTARREILSLEGQITDSTMCKLERGYAAVLQDLCECCMNLERWVERSVARTISTERIKQSFTSDSERVSRAPTTFQNAGLEVQLEELETSFQKLLEEAVRARQGGPSASDAQTNTVMEVRAEYEDKLNRMKAKMKQLYQDQIQVFKNKQKEEVAHLEAELARARDKLAESSRAYEEHIRALTAELWSVGEKFLMKKDEAEWLRKKKSGSLMSLQHLHSSGLNTNQEIPSTPASDTRSLRSLPVAQVQPRDRKQREGRGLHMSDEEGEVFDNRCLRELSPPAGGRRLSELRWRNSLCPPHLKSSYPAEMQFANTLDEEDIKFVGAPSLGKSQRKEVGITAYKKPGPPTPSKQAGRLSATDCELRESLRSEPEPTSRKTSTPGRIRAFFRSGRAADHSDLPDSECPISETSVYPKCDKENGNDAKNCKCDFENNTKRDSERINVDCDSVNRIPIDSNKNVKCDEEKRNLLDSEKRNSNDNCNLQNRNAKGNFENRNINPKITCDSENRKLMGSENKILNSMSANRNVNAKCDSENKNPIDTSNKNLNDSNSENRKRIDSINEIPECISANRNANAKYDSENRKPGFENIIRKNQNAKVENSKNVWNSEKQNPKCETGSRKNDWFKLSLRQRAALWEPLGKD